MRWMSRMGLCEVGGMVRMGLCEVDVKDGIM